VLNADTGLARWESSDAEPHDWVRRFTPDRARVESSGPALPYRATAQWTGPAVAVPFANQHDGDITVVTRTYEL
jgi:hypothetical protein